jgi:hypothetical protein
MKTVTGESYAGLFISYTANLIYARQSELALKLKGVLFIDPVLSRWPFVAHIVDYLPEFGVWLCDASFSSSVLQEDVFVYPFVKSVSLYEPALPRVSSLQIILPDS